MSKSNNEPAGTHPKPSLPVKPYEVVFEDITDRTSICGCEILCADYVPQERYREEETAIDYSI